ncbi:hypothetical protein [Eisenibacter elegans]|uniref:hypothetical protein n=1 Tax=Eisenibacter elegans TaxID=997 RepID=UPI000478BC15|nr:hypothetical protein [Eisenibacter elegans]
MDVTPNILPTTLHLSCQTCGQNQPPYQYVPEEVRALVVGWKTLDSQRAWPAWPEVGKGYLLTFTAPLTLPLDQPFWALFQHRMSMSEGIETEEDLQSLCFCQCVPRRVLQQEPFEATLEVEVIALKTLQALSTPQQPPLAWWSLLTDDNTFREYGHTANFQKYSLISLNLQSDLGLDLVVWKAEEPRRIVAANAWDAHLDEWVLCYLPLSPEQELLYGIC